MTESTKSHEAALDDFVERVEAGNLPSVRQLFVFGSVARGTHSADSDVDVLAILDADADVTEMEERLRDLAYDVMLDHGTVFSIHGVTQSTLDSRSDHPFFQRVEAEGRPIYG